MHTERSAQESLAARPDDDRPAEPGGERAAVPEQREVDLRVGSLTESEARVDPGAAPRRLREAREPVGELVGHRAPVERRRTRACRASAENTSDSERPRRWPAM